MAFDGEFFADLINKRGLSSEQILNTLKEEYNIEITENTLKSYRRKSGKNATPSLDKLKAFAQILNVTIDELANSNLNIRPVKQIPLIGKSSCGKPQNYDLNGHEPVPISIELYKDGMYAVEAEGDSMTPKINERDLVYCQPNRIIDNGNIVHYWLDGDSGIKKYKMNDAGTIISLIPINPSHEIITIHCDEKHELIMSRVVGKLDKNF